VCHAPAYTCRVARGESASAMMAGDPEELRPTPLVERTRALYHALVTADPPADMCHHPITAAFVGCSANGPLSGEGILVSLPNRWNTY